jgi:UDP-GlcNAc:undecaprenyl-phosphate GlcNAc-1-phosphate transferase
MTYLMIYYFLLSTILCAITIPFIKRAAFKYGAINNPGNHPKKIHTKPTPLLGGLAVYISLASSVLIYIYFGQIDFSIVPLKFLLAILFGGLVLILGGAADDKFDLPPKILWLFPAVASLIVVFSGIGVGITFLSNPFGHEINLRYVILGLPLSGIVMWFWMMGMIFTTKFLDGMDGLCSGIGFIASCTMLALSLTSKINQPVTATLAIIFAGALLGYLFYGFNPASIFLGEGGSTLVGFMIGVLAIILGGKIATALIVMGIPILDIAWAITRRLWYGRSPFMADRLHLHHRLLDIGFSQRQTVLILYLISAIFGTSAVFLQSFGKLVALLIMFGLMVIMAIAVVMIFKKQHPHVPRLEN